MTVDEIKASNKQEVHPPMNFHELQEQLLMFIIENDIFFSDLSSMVSQCLKVLMNMMNHHKSIFKSKDCLYKEFPANKIPDLVEQMQVSSKSQQSQRLDHQLPPTHQQSHFWLFLHGSPSNFLYEVSKQHHSCRTRRWRQTPRNRQHQARWKEKRKVKR